MCLLLNYWDRYVPCGVVVSSQTRMLPIFLLLFFSSWFFLALSSGLPALSRRHAGSIFCARGVLMPWFTFARQNDKTRRTTPFRYLQLHTGAPQHHSAGSHRQRKELSILLPCMDVARRFYVVKYIHLPDLLLEFQIARDNGTIRKLMAQPSARNMHYSLLTNGSCIRWKKRKSETCWKSWSPGTSETPRSSVPSLTFRVDQRNCLARFWQMKSATGSFTTPTP